MRTFMAVDQHKNIYRGLVHPRKDLLKRLGRKHAVKMYRDGANGPKHIGYVIGGLWLALYEVKLFEKEE